jgi:hypothetical protein
MASDHIAITGELIEGSPAVSTSDIKRAVQPGWKDDAT